MEENIYKKIKDNFNSFAKNLKLERLSRNLTQKQVAEMLNIKTQSYQAYESGISLPTVENLLKISIIFKISLDELFEIDT